MFANPANGQVLQWPIRDSADLRIALSKLNQQKWMINAQEPDRSVVSTIVSELGTNLIKYSEQGDITISCSSVYDCVVEIRAQDRGPGIADLSLAMQDHFTTGHTLGLGLPGVKRMADSFYIASSKVGTTVVATKSVRFAHGQTAECSAATLKTVEPQQLQRWDIGSAVSPMVGQIQSGDIAVFVENPDALLLVLADVTGHGERAHLLGKQIEAVVQLNSKLQPTELMQTLHQELVGTVGAAASIFAVNLRTAQFRYVGVGNTGICRTNGHPWSGISRDGLLGTHLPNVTEQSGTLHQGDAFLIWTDGIPGRLGRHYLAQHYRHSSHQIASDLVKTLGKGHDDAGCIVFRWL